MELLELTLEQKLVRRAQLVGHLSRVDQHLDRGSFMVDRPDRPQHVGPFPLLKTEVLLPQPDTFAS